MKIPCPSAVRGAALALSCCLAAGQASAVALDPATLPASLLPKSGPSGAEARYLAGLRAVTGNKLDDADRAFRGCLEVAPKAAACMLGVATVAADRGNRDESGKWIERAAAAEPDNPYAQASLGRWHAVNGRIEQAIAALEKAAGLDPRAVRPRVDLGDIYLTNGDLDRAIGKYREALAIDDSHAGAHYALGAALTRRGDATGAAREFKRATGLAPGNPLPALELARLYSAAGDLKEAEKYAREAVRIQPTLVPARLALGQILESTGRYDEAMREYRDMAAANPGLAAPSFHVGALLHRKGDLAGAAAEYGKALKTDAAFAPALNNLASIELARNKAPARAEELARKAVAAAPGVAAYHDTLAEVLKARGNAKAALVEQQEAVRLEPGNPVYLARAGTLQAQLGQKKEASASLGRALQMSSSFPGADEARRLLESLKR